MPPQRIDSWDYMRAAFLGLGAAVLRVLYSFFPGAIAVDVLLFGAVGAAVARRVPARRWRMVAVVSFPALLLFGYLVVVGLGAEQPGWPNGLEWLLPAVLIPAAAAAGAAIATLGSGHARDARSERRHT